MFPQLSLDFSGSSVDIEFGTAQKLNPSFAILNDEKAADVTDHSLAFYINGVKCSSRAWSPVLEKSCHCPG